MTITARDFIKLALKEANVVGLGQTPIDEYSNNGFILLTRMLNQWQKRRWIVPALKDISALGNGLKSNKIGPGQYWNYKRPDKIESGYVIQLNTGQNPVSMPLTQIFSYEDYGYVAVKNLPSLPTKFFYDGAFPYGNIFILPVPNNQYEIHLITKTIIGFSTGLNEGRISSSGIGYVNGVYPDVPFIETDEGGNLGTADITVAGGIVTNVTIKNPGNGYVINDYLSVDTADIGGTGQGFVYNVTNTEGTLDSLFNMPEEYEDAIHYNMVKRLAMFYQKPVTKDVRIEARTSLNTIINSNTQVPTLNMPAGLSRGRALNIYNPDGY